MGNFPHRQVLKSLIHNGLSPTVSALSALPHSHVPLLLDHQQQKKPSPSTELLCVADEIRTRAGARFHIHVTPWHLVPSPRRTEVVSSNLMLLSTIDNKKSPVLRLSFSAVRTRFELATSGVTGRHSNQLNYRTIWFWDCKCKSLL